MHERTNQTYSTTFNVIPNFALTCLVSSFIRIVCF